ISRFWVSMIDVTALKIAQLSLRRSEEKYSKAFQSSPDAIVITRLADGHIIEVNEGFETMTGFSREEVLGRRTVELDLWWDEKDRDEAVRLLLEGKHVRNIEADFRTRSEEKIPCLTSAELIELRGEQCILSTTRDYSKLKAAETERRRLEARLRQAQKMEVMGQLTSGIVHDFNNILSSVIGYSELAAENPVVKENEKVHGYMAEVQRAGQRARALVNQMLVFSRYSTDASTNVEPSDLVAGVIRMLRPTLPSTIEVDTELGDGVVTIDPVQFEQALINLCINARDAMRGGGQLSIAVRQEPVAEMRCAACGESPATHCVAISVVDTGDGISPDVLPQLFEPFFSTKPSSRGTGMGLAMVDNIVHAHDGHIHVDSSASGSRFTMLFPAATRASRKPPTISPVADFDQSANTGAHILVVDDEQSVGTLMGRLLESRGYSATVVDSSERALDYFASNADSIDAVITDQTMPKMTGMQLSKQLLEVRPDLPIILCSGYSTDVNEKTVKQAGISAYQSKPIDVSDFFKQLQTVIPGLQNGLN
ncbi:MAG: response regulator, partial [Pseudomonadota bacterium]